MAVLVALYPTLLSLTQLLHLYKGTRNQGSCLPDEVEAR